MTTNTIVRLGWAKPETIRIAKDLIQLHDSVELELPSNYHHAIYMHLNPNADPGKPEEVDILGGADLLSQVAEMQGLSDLSELIVPVMTERATVHLISPTPCIRIEFPDKSG